MFSVFDKLLRRMLFIRLLCLELGTFEILIVGKEMKVFQFTACIQYSSIRSLRCSSRGIF